MEGFFFLVWIGKSHRSLTHLFSTTFGDVFHLDLRPPVHTHMFLCVMSATRLCRSKYVLPPSMSAQPTSVGCGLHFSVLRKFSYPLRKRYCAYWGCKNCEYKKRRYSEQNFTFLLKYFSQNHKCHFAWCDKKDKSSERPKCLPKYHPIQYFRFISMEGGLFEEPATLAINYSFDL